MKSAFLIIFLGLSNSALALDQMCVKTLASAPYCMNVLSAESNCETGEGPAIKVCLDNYFTKIPAGLPKEHLDRFRKIMIEACYTHQVTDLRSWKNRSYCDGDIEADAKAAAAAKAKASNSWFSFGTKKGSQ